MDYSSPETGKADADFPLFEGTVRDRIVDFLGGRDLASASCTYLASCDSLNPAKLQRWPVVELDRLLRRGGGIARSLYDTHSILVHLDIEYVNHDSPAEAFTNPWKAFRLQEPVVAKIEELLAGGNTSASSSNRARTPFCLAFSARFGAGETHHQSFSVRLSRRRRTGLRESCALDGFFRFSDQSRGRGRVIIARRGHGGAGPPGEFGAAGADLYRYL